MAVLTTPFDPLPPSLVREVGVAAQLSAIYEFNHGKKAVPNPAPRTWPRVVAVDDGIVGYRAESYQSVSEKPADELIASATPR
jgi:hypothetical protein